MSEQTEQARTSVETKSGGAQRLVLKNAVVFLVAQVAAMPLSLVVNAAMARYLGPEDFGLWYLTSTFCTFAFLLVEWGQSALLPALVAKDRSQAGEFLGSSLMWRIVSAPVAYGLMALGCLGLGYGREFQIALALVALGMFLWNLSAACLETIRGFERTDAGAYALAGRQMLSALIVIPTLFLGGRLRAALAAQALAAAVIAWFVSRALRTIGPIRLSWSRPTLRKLVSEGTSFLALGVCMFLQPNVDAVFLSKLAPAETVGWHAAATKLVGVLIFPASALAGALYPTLSRLYVEDRDAFRRSAAGALRAATALVVPLALGCALYPDLGIRVYSRHSFGHAEDNLRILSIFVLLLYFSMTLGIILAAMGKQRAWSISQFMCVVASVILDPVLIPWFQSRFGNGGLGVCTSSVVSETLMVAAGCWLAPPGVLDRRFLRGLALALLSGGAFVVAARLLSGLTPFLAAPLSVVAYGACLSLTGGLDPEQMATIRRAIARRLPRKLRP
jgi:O-antigen/teichoic acid export membrane protein